MSLKHIYRATMLLRGIPLVSKSKEGRWLAQKMQSCFFSLWRLCRHFRTWTRFPEIGVVLAVNAPPTLYGHLGLRSVPALCWRFGGQSVLNHQMRRQIKCCEQRCSSKIMFCDLIACRTVPDVVHDGRAQAGNCLLYTSPSPRDVEESRMPSSA